jgi:hypothetical protein
MSRLVVKDGVIVREDTGEPALKPGGRESSNSESNNAAGQPAETGGSDLGGPPLTELALAAPSWRPQQCICGAVGTLPNCPIHAPSEKHSEGTPRTDAFSLYVRQKAPPMMYGEECHAAWSDFARQLERELAAQEVQMNAVRHRAEKAESALSASGECEKCAKRSEFCSICWPRPTDNRSPQEGKDG